MDVYDFDVGRDECVHCNAGRWLRECDVEGVARNMQKADQRQ